MHECFILCDDLLNIIHGAFKSIVQQCCPK